MKKKLNHELEIATSAALEAGELLRQEFHRQGGPRGELGKCPADAEAEALIRAKLRAVFPDDGIVGEELSHEDRPARAGGRVWLVDPNDGTTAFQKGWRGAAVSIGLVSGGLPVLGVVYAYASRSGRGDLFTWAEGEPFVRNGEEVALPVQPAPTVLVSQDGDRNPEGNARLCHPHRFRCEPSIAYRLALVAAGEGVAASSACGPGDYDVAGGHALLRAVGAELYGQEGEPVRYEEDGHARVGDCVGGFAPVAAELATRDWYAVRGGTENPAEDELLRPAAGHAVSDTGLLDRACGCLAGQLAGDNLGSLCEFWSAQEVESTYPGGPRRLVDGGVWDLLAGQPTDDSELALALARSILGRGTYDPEEAAGAYAEWYGGEPFDVGGTTENALQPAWEAHKARLATAGVARAAAGRMEGSKANGALMRVSPLGIWGHAMDPGALAAHAHADALLTHAHASCQDANAVFAVALAYAVRTGAKPREVYDHACDWARGGGVCREVQDWLKEAKGATSAEMDGRQKGFVRHAFQNAFHELLHAKSVEEGLARTIARGGDTDTNAAIAGALLGAVHGLESFPKPWVDRLLTCRPLEDLPECEHPRPSRYWPVDFRLVAEALVFLGAEV
jgi:ADP-ribosylglycohydrolase/fructose-1,6-bisphosphatase/inositol monophosphatase family enzyme